MEAVGICGSDIHAVHGKHPFMSFPIVLGHEATGEVVETGKDVTSVAVGDRVIYRPQKICGECLQCRTGHYNICDRLEVLGCQDTGCLLYTSSVLHQKHRRKGSHFLTSEKNRLEEWTTALQTAQEQELRSFVLSLYFVCFYRQKT